MTIDGLSFACGVAFGAALSLSLACAYLQGLVREVSANADRLEEALVERLGSVLADVLRKAEEDMHPPDVLCPKCQKPMPARYGRIGVCRDCWIESTVKSVQKEAQDGKKD